MSNLWQWNKTSVQAIPFKASMDHCRILDMESIQIQDTHNDNTPPISAYLYNHPPKNEECRV